MTSCLYGSFQPRQIAATVALREARDQPTQATAMHEGRRNALCDGLTRADLEIARQATTFVSARIPTDEKAQDFAVRLVREAHILVSPNSGFRADGEGFVRFALVQKEQRIAPAVREIRRSRRTPSPVGWAGAVATGEDSP